MVTRVQEPSRYGVVVYARLSLSLSLSLSSLSLSPSPSVYLSCFGCVDAYACGRTHADTRACAHPHAPNDPPHKLQTVALLSDSSCCAAVMTKGKSSALLRSRKRLWAIGLMPVCWCAVCCVLLRYAMFCSVLFCFVMLCYVLFFSFLFCSVMFYSYVC
jgi:hypothetical protein